MIDGQDGRDILLVNAGPIPKESVDRWARRMNAEYNNLLESEKASDRIEAKRIIKCMEDGSIF